MVVVLPDAERGYGHPGENHVDRSAAGLVHQQEGEISVRDPLKQRKHLMFTQNSSQSSGVLITELFAANPENRIPNLTVDINSDYSR